MNTMFEIEPAKKVGRVEFGMSRDEVRKVLGEPVSEFKKTKWSVNTTDNYGDFHVFYDSNNTCEAVELFGGCTATFNGNILFPSDRDGFTALLRAMDADCVMSEYDVVSKNVSIGASFEARKVSSVLFAKEGYYVD